MSSSHICSIEKEELDMFLSETHDHTKKLKCTSPLPSSRSWELVLLLLRSHQNFMKFYFIGQEFNAITLADWILFQSVNDLGPFPVACLRHRKNVVQLHPTRDFIYEVSVLGPLIDKFLGRRDQGSFSNEKRGTSLLSFKPIHKRNNTFLSFPVSIYKCWERHKSESSDVNNKPLSSTKFSSSPAAANESVFQAAISCRSSSRPSSMVISYGWWRREQEVTTRASISEEDQQETNATRIVSST